MARPPFGPYDKIEVHRYSPAKREGAGPVLFYLPGTNRNGELALTDEKHNLWLYRARRGADVYTLDYRTRFVPGAGVADFSFLAGWTYQAFLEDIAEAVALARKQSGGGCVFLSGFSRGVGLAYLYASDHRKQDLCGLVMLDGALKNPASDVGGSLGWEKRQELMKAVMGASPEAAKQLADILSRAFRMPGALPGALANAVEGFSDPHVLARLLVGCDRHYPAVQILVGRIPGRLG